jgi:hypothetical protein
MDTIATDLSYIKISNDGHNRTIRSIEYVLEF